MRTVLVIAVVGTSRVRGSGSWGERDVEDGRLGVPAPGADVRAPELDPVDGSDVEPLADWPTPAEVPPAEVPPGEVPPGELVPGDALPDEVLPGAPDVVPDGCPPGPHSGLRWSMSRVTITCASDRLLAVIPDSTCDRVTGVRSDILIPVRR